MRLRAQFVRTVVLSIAAVLAISFSTLAQTTPPRPAPATDEHFVGTAANFGPATGDTISIDLIRWSTPQESGPLATAARDKAASEVGAILKALPNLGYIWRSGSAVGAVIRHAASWKDRGEEHVVLATDSDLNLWKQDSATPAAAARPFTVLEIVIPANGVGTGKLSVDGKVIGDVAHQTIGIDGYGAAPVVVTGIKRVRGGS